MVVRGVAAVLRALMVRGGRTGCRCCPQGRVRSAAGWTAASFASATSSRSSCRPRLRSSPSTREASSAGSRTSPRPASASPTDSPWSAGHSVTRVKTPTGRSMCYMCSMNVVTSTRAGQVIFVTHSYLHVVLECGHHRDPPRSRPTRL